MPDIAYKEDVLLFLDAEIEEEKHCESKIHATGRTGHNDAGGILWYVKFYGDCNCISNDIIYIRCNGFVQYCITRLADGTPLKCGRCYKLWGMNVIERAN